MNVNEFERTKPVVTMQKINDLIKLIDEERVKTEILYCRERHHSIDKSLEEIKEDIATILAEQAKMRGFISGVAFVFAGIGVLIAHFIDKLGFK